MPQRDGSAETGQEAERASAEPRVGLHDTDPRRARPGRAPDGRSARGRVLHSDARGDVAQLEEHRVRIAGVRGSSPLISTTPCHGPRSRIGGPGVDRRRGTRRARRADPRVHPRPRDVPVATPRGLKAFGTTPEQAETMATLAANQGLYNGFLAAGLGLAWSSPNPAPCISSVLPWLRHRRRPVRRADRVAADPGRPGAARRARPRCRPSGAVKDPALTGMRARPADRVRQVSAGEGADTRQESVHRQDAPP